MDQSNLAIVTGGPFSSHCVSGHSKENYAMLPYLASDIKWFSHFMKIHQPLIFFVSTPLPLVPHICIGESDNGLLPDWRQAIICTNTYLLSFGPPGAKISNISIKIQNISFTKMYLKISSVKWWPFYTRGNELTYCGLVVPYCPMDHYQHYWRHQMETFSMLLALCEGNPPFTGGFPSQRPVMRSFDVLYDVCLSNGWANSWYTCDLKFHGAHCDVTVMRQNLVTCLVSNCCLN